MGVGVFLDMGGNICGEKGHVCVKGVAEDAQVLATAAFEDGLTTEPGKWRKIKIKFDTQEQKCDVKINGKKVIDDLKFDGITIPPKVAPGICAATSDGFC